MTKCSIYTVEFTYKFKPDRDFWDLPVYGLTVQVVAEDISDAMKKAWDSVRITSEDYEIEQVSRNGSRYNNRS